MNPVPSNKQRQMQLLKSKVVALQHLKHSTFCTTLLRAKWEGAGSISYILCKLQVVIFSFKKKWYFKTVMEGGVEMPWH